MPLEISYLGGSRTGAPIAGTVISSETRTLSSVSAQAGATPGNAVIVSILATEAARFAYGANPTATATAGANGHFLALGERIELDAVAGHKVAGIVAA